MTTVGKRWLLICCLVAALHAGTAFAKQRADLIVVHGTVVTMDGKRRILEDGALAVQGDAIAAIDATANIDARYESDKVIDARGGSDSTRTDQRPHTYEHELVAWPGGRSFSG